jgi:hypothetical protein
MQAERRYPEFGYTLREEMPMPKPLSDDLRCRILDTYEQKEGSQSKLAARFGISFDYVHKILVCGAGVVPQARAWRRGGDGQLVGAQGVGVREKIEAHHAGSLFATLFA